MEPLSRFKIMILWKLNELMAAQRKRNKDLAEFLGVSENAVYRLRKRDDMPRLTGDTLNGICAFLDCNPGDLLVRENDEVAKDA